MEKRVLLGVQKKKVLINKRNKKNKYLLNKVVDYLKSDSYLFAPLTSPSSRSDLRSLKTVEIKEKAKENDKRLLKKVGDYLISDSYMYAPLVVPPKPLFTPPKGPQRSIKRVTMEVSRSSISLKDNNYLANEIAHGQVSKDHLPEKVIPDRRSLVHKESVTKIMYQNCLSSSMSEKGMLGSHRRKVVQ